MQAGPLQNAIADGAVLSARETVLQLLEARPGETLGSADLARGAETLDFAAPAIRMAISRLLADGEIVSPARGRYRLGERRAAAQTVWGAWRTAERRLRPWTGRWLVVVDAAAPRGPAKAERAHKRALRLFGFAEAEAGLWARADNLIDDLDAVASGLGRAGLKTGTRVLGPSSADGESDAAFRGLHDAATLETAYRDGLARLPEQTKALAEAPVAAAMAAAFHIGREAIRSIAFDPLLPEELADARLRSDYFKSARAFVDAGYAVWRGALT